MYLDMQRTRVYKDNYRPSSNFYRFFTNLMSIIIDGHSTFGSSAHFYYNKKKK